MKSKKRSQVKKLRKEQKKEILTPEVLNKKIIMAKMRIADLMDDRNRHEHQLNIVNHNINYIFDSLMKLHRLIAERREEMYRVNKLTRAVQFLTLSLLFWWFAFIFCGWIGLVAKMIFGLFGGLGIGDLFECWQMTRKQKSAEKPKSAEEKQ